ncbi:MAG: O-antigen ligase family protein [Pyrinomonadaceae bacterium]
MTTLLFSEAAVPAFQGRERELPVRTATQEASKRRHTLASRLVFVTICVTIVMTTLAFGTVHYWALAAFTAIAAALVCLWCLDGLTLHSVQLSRNALQWPLAGMIVLGLVQLLPLRAPDDTAGLQLSLSRALSLDPNSTRLVLVQLLSLLIFFSATLIFTDSPRRLRALTRTIIIFGFLLAMFGVTQSLTSNGTRIYWYRQLTQSTGFGPFINRHHFAGYMELVIGLPLGLLFSGSLEAHKRPLYAFAGLLMAVALILTTSRGGIISLVAEILFIVVVAAPGVKYSEQSRKGALMRTVLWRAAMAFGLVLILFFGGLAAGGPGVFDRLLGTVNLADPTTGRAHFWDVTLDVIKNHPVLGSGLGSFGVIYTRYDSRNGLYRLEQAHNDYLQTLADGGIVGGLLGLSFLIILFRGGFARRLTSDKFRSGVATGALAGCFAVLVHSAFDFTLHTTANALLFLVLAAMATLDRRVDEGTTHRRRRRRRGSTATVTESETASAEAPGLRQPKPA